MPCDPSWTNRESQKEPTMISNPYLFAAYAATWIIHITYLSTIMRRYARLKREVDELNRK
jgi:CcmD family protein